ncbi:hypothetical protein BJ875DRAFT_445344 [Amylocarpus encephaloides]|uniref:Uncharacterized protein n=1 Tax=Amylocarpus encephaloides TaxID=45428 RepID=A0A9P7YBR3_9HELO|nr:hypothetical protein BJ875DRAFT_445344 [Amylocarpus encephaloides]
MPPRKSIGAPADHVYKPSTPLRQAKLPAPRKRVTYGKHSGPRISKPDNTLTQMDFVHMSHPVEGQEDEEDDPIEDQEQEPEEETYEVVSKKRGKRRKTTGDLPLEDEQGVGDRVLKDAGKKRRKTISDLPEEIEEEPPGELGKRQKKSQPTSEIAVESEEEQEEEPKRRKSKGSSRKPGNIRRKPANSKPATPQYHTQTITQLDWSFGTAPEDPEDPEDGEGEGEGEELVNDIYDGPYSSQPPAKAAIQAKQIAVKIEGEGSLENDISSGQFSGHSTITALEGAKISPPTKQSPNRTMLPPPTPRHRTPFEIPSSQSPVTPMSLTRTPLNERAINSTPIPFNPRRDPTVRPKLEIRDTFDTSTDMSSDPARHYSPGKTVRFDLPQCISEGEGQEGEEEDIQEDAACFPSARGKSRMPQESQVLGKDLEILDSDAEKEDDEEAEEGPLNGATNEPIHKPEPEPTHETCYGDIGLETQFEADELLTSTAQNPSPEHMGDDEHLPRDSQQVEGEEHLKSDGFSERPQIMESQRLSTQQVHSMAPRTLESDVFVNVPKLQIEEILDRSRDHLTRAWVIPTQASRIWMYVPQPVSNLRYMAVIGPGKQPGRLTNESGKGNADFNKKYPNSKWRAYEILELYELADPLPLATLQASEWLERAPRKFKNVPPAVLDQLMANLLPPIWDAMTEEGSPQSSTTDTQEVAAQLMSEQSARPEAMAHSSIPSSPPVLKKRSVREPILDAVEEYDPELSLPTHDNDRRILSSQKPTPRQPNIIRPSQASTVDLSQTQNQQSMQDLVPESPTRGHPNSSSPLKLPTPRGSDSNQGPESLVPFSIASSQLFTKSQMLPESLLVDSVFDQTRFVKDSEDEDEDED